MSGTTKKDCPDGSCPIDKPKGEKLVRSTDLPLDGNPYPAKDVFLKDEPGFLETKVRAVRLSLQPLFSPVFSAYESTSDFLAIGVSHTQSAINQLSENRSNVVNAAVIASSGLLGVTIARRRGFFKKFLFGSVFFGGALALCYPKESEEYSKMLLYIARNKLPTLAKQQYEKISIKSSTETKTENGEQKSEN